MTIFTKQTKKKFKEARKIILKNFEISFNSTSSIVGFLLGQFVWIWILNGFIGWFLLWFMEVTQYTNHIIPELRTFFWVMYGVWFFLCILSRLNKIKYYK